MSSTCEAGHGISFSRHRSDLIHRWIISGFTELTKLKSNQISSKCSPKVALILKCNLIIFVPLHDYLICDFIKSFPLCSVEFIMQCYDYSTNVFPCFVPACVNVVTKWERARDQLVNCSEIMELPNNTIVIEWKV